VARLRTDDPRFAEFSERLGALLLEFSDISVPVVPPEGEHCHADEDDPLCRCQPMKQPVVAEWSLIVDWTDLSDNDSYISGASAPHMRLTHTIGLVTRYLDLARGR
jgi:hypothetical protein